MEGLSRARVQALIDAGAVAVRRPAAKVLAPSAVRSSLRLRKGDVVEVEVLPPEPSALSPEAAPLEIVFEDPHLLVVNKPAGLTVHPGAGRRSGTLVHALLHHCPGLPGVGEEHRPGIVHRLDKDTSGLIVVAKSEEALAGLAAQIRSRRAHREYIALVHGRVARDRGAVEAPIGRDPRRRTRMAIVASGRRAVTHYRVVERFPGASMLELKLETGRTHQIRVHCAHMGHPIIGDPVYGRRAEAWGMSRQALHASRLSFTHPIHGTRLSLSAPLPADIAAVLSSLTRTKGDRGTDGVVGGGRS